MICLQPSIIFFSTLTFFGGFSNGYKILFIMSPLSARSHSIYIDVIAVDLSSRGHQVTCVSSGPFSYIDGVEHIHMDPLPLPISLFDFKLTHFFQINQLVQPLADISLSNHLIANLTSEPNDPRTGRAKYDIVILDGSWTEQFLPLIHKMNVPFMFISTSYLITCTAWNLNLPLPFSYFNNNGFPVPMSVLHRAANALISLGMVFYLNNFFIPMEQLAIRKYFPDSPPILDIMYNASFMMINVNPSIQDSIPSMDLAAQIGCPHCRPARSLSKNLEAIMQSSGEAGVIYFSMGTIVNAEWIPKTFLNNLVKALSELPQIVIWNCKANITIPPNFRQDSWIPQQDILAHPKLRLFINHAGLMSVQEASYHGCPVLGFPICCDTYYAANLAEKHGFGEQLDWRTVTANKIRDTIHSMINDTRYKTAANKVSMLMKDVLMSPTELASYWIEYVIRHKELRIRNPSSKNVNLFQYFLLDVALLIAVVCSLLIAISWLTAKRLTFVVSYSSGRFVSNLLRDN